MDDDVGAMCSSSSSTVASKGVDQSARESASESEEQSCSTPPSKCKRYTCIFRKERRKTFPWATDSKRRHSYAFCVRCSRDICMAHGGVKDLKKHKNTALSHSERSTVGALPLSSCYGPVRSSEVLEAEVKFGYFLGEHHLAFNITDHASKLFSSMFPDSAIAKEFKCGRTKATAILRAIAEDAWESIQNAVKDSKYISIQTDETTDLTVNQQMAIMLGFFENSCGAVQCLFFKLEAVPRATAEQLYELINKHFQGSDILNYEHLVGLGTDGANVILGQRNSVMSRLREKHCTSL